MGEAATILPSNNRQLFHPDNNVFFDFEGLRREAREEVESSTLIQRAAAGDRDAAVGLKSGFWYFVRSFEQAIDQRCNSSRLPREPLYEKFGRDATRKTLLASARNIRDLEESEINGVFTEAERALMEMQQEEKTHAAHWAKDAENLGLSRDALDAMHIVAGVKRLVEGAYAADLVDFFARSLASTEFIAEELGDVLARNPAYTNLFRRKRAVWMEVHTIPHDDGPSHADIVLDFARAYSDGLLPREIQARVVEGIRAFGAAARDVEEYFCP